MTDLDKRPLAGVESRGQQQLFESPTMAEYWQEMYGFLSDELNEEAPDISSETGILIALDILGIASEGFARQLAGSRGLDPEASNLDSTVFVSRMFPKGESNSEDPFVFDVDHNSEFVGDSITPEMVTALTNRAYRMARLVVDEVYFGELIKGQFTEAIR